MKVSTNHLIIKHKREYIELTILKLKHDICYSCSNNIKISENNLNKYFVFFQDVFFSPTTKSAITNSNTVCLFLILLVTMQA